MRVTFLGTGTSRGVPFIGCLCKVCTSLNPKNKRLRSSILIESEVNVVIDASVDFRLQMLRYQVKRLDAILCTHSHVDHIMGLDDVYPFNIWMEKSIPVYANKETLRDVKLTFRHLFADKHYPGTASLKLVPIEDKFKIGDLQFEPIPVFHGTLPILGFRLENFAYVTDVSYIPEESMHKLQNLDCLILDGLRYQSHPTHLSLSEAVEIALCLKPRETYLIHITHDVDHAEADKKLPKSVKLSYDGMVLEL